MRASAGRTPSLNPHGRDWCSIVTANKGARVGEQLTQCLVCRHTCEFTGLPVERVIHRFVREHNALVVTHDGDAVVEQMQCGLE